MADHDAETGHEVVLDNRKLIVAFIVLIAICGCFFVVGYKEGKQQGFQEGSQTAAETAHKGTPQTQAPKPATADSGATPPKEDPGEQQLNWQKVVTSEEAKESSHISKPVKEPVKEPVKDSVKEPVRDIEKKPVADSEVKPKPQANAAHSEAVTYSVQVGAFRVRHEVESKAKTLRSQGYDCRIEEPQSPEDLYLLKVGKYTLRAEAVAMQLRLKKSGLKSFVKTN